MSSITARSFAENRSLFGPAGGTSRLDADMAHLLSLLDKAGPRRIEGLTVTEARQQPTLTGVLRAMMRNPDDDMGVGSTPMRVPGAAGELDARLYRPHMAAEGELPLVLYLPSGGFVLADLDVADAAPRLLAKRLEALVLAVRPRQAPEATFPAAHDDAVALWEWLSDNAAALGASAEQLAIAGDGAGGNLAVHIAITARARQLAVPRHLALISPMASPDFTLSSYQENKDSWPLNAAGVEWCYARYVPDKADLRRPEFDLVNRADLNGLPPTTIILPEVDPLRSEGTLLAQALRRAGVWVDDMVYDGVTHQFFNLPQAVNKALFAGIQVTRNISSSFGRL